MGIRNIAVLVTYNKPQLLEECLNAILEQSTPIDKVVVIDNNSNEQTGKVLSNFSGDKIVVVKLDSNIGGAGGFNRGMKEAMKLNPTDGLWIMDDDTIPSKTAFEQIQKTKNTVQNEFSFICSNVRWTDGKACIMNIPGPAGIWNEFVQNGAVKVNMASFVSIYFSSEAIKKVGFPISEFFIWGDDMEYTQRISKYKDAYFANNSIVTHKMASNQDVNILTATEDKIPRYFFDIRNKFFIAKSKGFKETLKFIYQTAKLSMKIVIKSDFKWKKLSAIHRGFWAGVFFNPKIENYVEN